MTKKGTTLLELTIMVAIIGIMTVFAMHYYNNEIDKVSRDATKAKINQLKDAVKQFYAETGRFPSSILEMKGRYIQNYPVRNGWSEIIELVEDSPVPTLFYKNRVNGNVNTVYIKIFDPWEIDSLANGDLEDLFNQQNYPSKVLIGKSFVDSYKIDEEYSGKDKFGRDIPNKWYGEYVFAASVEVYIKGPDDTDTTKIDKGHDFKFSITGGIIDNVECDDPSAVLDVDDSEFTSTSTSEVVVYTFDVYDCPFLTLFQLELYKPRNTGTRVFYGQHQIFEVPQAELESYMDGTTEIWTKPLLPVKIERSFHESTKDFR